MAKQQPKHEAFCCTVPVVGLSNPARYNTVIMASHSYVQAGSLIVLMAHFHPSV